MKQDTIKYVGLSVIIRNEEEYNKIKEFLGDDLYVDYVPQMSENETAIVIYYDGPDNAFSTGSVGLLEWQEGFGCRLVEFSDFF